MRTGYHNKIKTDLLRYPYLIGLFLVIATVVVYSPVGHFDFINFDDDEYITDNSHIAQGLTWEGVRWSFNYRYASNWHPLTWMSHMLDIQLYGMNAGGHHLNNVLLHTLNTLLLFIVFLKMTHDPWRSGFIAVLFALHPMHIESVAWVSERKDVLSTLFWMLTLLSYLYYVQKCGFWRYTLVLLFFALGLMAKPMLVSLPFVLLLLDYWPLGRIDFKSPANTIALNKAIMLRLLLEKLPLLVLTLASIVFTLMAQTLSGAVASLNTYPFTVRFANAVLAYIKYIFKLIWPSNLSVFYPYPNTFSEWQVAIAVISVFSVSVCSICFMKRLPYLFTGWLWYVGTLLPVIGIVQVGIQAMADRYTYIPFIGLFLIIAYATPGFFRRLHLNKTYLFIIAFCIICLLAIKTSRHLHNWQNSVTLFKQALKATKNNSLAHYNLGVALSDQGQITQAMVHYRKALRIRPNHADAHSNLGALLDERGELESALYHYKQAIRINPKHVGAHTNLGGLLIKKGRINDAKRHLSFALQIEPNNAIAHNNMAIAMSYQGKIFKALTHLQKALQSDADDPKISRNYKILSAIREKINAKARATTLELLRREPENPYLYFLLGRLNRNSGRTDQAIRYYQKALSLKPDFTEAMQGLAIVMAMKGRYENATGFLKQLISIKPGDPETYYLMASIYARQKKTDEAVNWLKRAIDKGFTKFEMLKRDENLKNIRETSFFRKLLK